MDNVLLVDKFARKARSPLGRKEIEELRRFARRLEPQEPAKFLADLFAFALQRQYLLQKRQFHLSVWKLLYRKTKVGRHTYDREQSEIRDRLRTLTPVVRRLCAAVIDE